MSNQPDTLNFFQLRDLADEKIRNGQGSMVLAVRDKLGMIKTRSIIRRIVKRKENGKDKEYYLMD